MRQRCLTDTPTPTRSHAPCYTQPDDGILALHRKLDFVRVCRKTVLPILLQVGGCDKIRPLWRHYFQNTDGVMLFVDSNDRERIQEVSRVRGIP